MMAGKVLVTGGARFIGTNLVSRLKDVLGLTPQVTLADSLHRFVRWVLTQALPEVRLAEANAELGRRGMME